MATGASGSFTSTGTSYNVGDVTMTVWWTQKYNAGDTYSTVEIYAELTRGASGGAAGGTWYCNGDGGILVDGYQAVGWTKNQTGVWTNAGQTGWSGSGSVRVNHTVAKSIDIQIQSVFWQNGSYYNSSFTIPAKTQAVTLQAIPQAHTLTISQGTGSWVSVSRGGNTLSNGATIYDGDVLTITGGANTGYNFGGLTVDGSAFTSGNTKSVSGNVSVSTSASVKSFTLALSAGTGTYVTAKRNSSPLAGASTGTLSNGSTLYYNDVIELDYFSYEGYAGNGSALNYSLYTGSYPIVHTVTGNVSYASYNGAVKSFPLTVSAAPGTAITVSRTSSPKAGAATGNLSSGATVYYSDVLQITVSAAVGWELTGFTVNSGSFQSGNSHTVTGAVTVISTSKQMGLAYIGGEKYLCYIGNGLYIPYVGPADGSQWELLS